MNVYTTDKIRNVCLLGHGGSGKTSLVEAMAYLSGITSRMGKVTDGNTVSDYGKEEQKRQFSISTSVIPIEWEGHKINILDISQTIVDDYFNMMMIADMSDAAKSVSEVSDDLDQLGADIGVIIRCQREEIFNSMHRV